MKLKQIELLFVITFAIIGLLFIVWGLLQIAGMVSYVNHWSDMAAFMLGANFIIGSWFINNGRTECIKHNFHY